MFVSSTKNVNCPAQTIDLDQIVSKHYDKGCSQQTPISRQDGNLVGTPHVHEHLQQSTPGARASTEDQAVQGQPCRHGFQVQRLMLFSYMVLDLNLISITSIRT